MPYVRCNAGKCVFRNAVGQPSDDLPAPRRKKTAPKDTPTNQLSPSQLVYDVQTDANAKCEGNCRCFIIIQTIDTKANAVVSEALRASDGDDPDGLTKQEHDHIDADAKKAAHREVKFIAACIQMDPDPNTGRLNPKQ